MGTNPVTQPNNSLQEALARTRAGGRVQRAPAPQLNTFIHLTSHDNRGIASEGRLIFKKWGLFNNGVKLRTTQASVKNGRGGGQPAAPDLHLPLDGQFLVGGLLDVNDDLLVHSCSQLEALFVLVLHDGAAQTEEERIDNRTRQMLWVFCDLRGRNP